MFHQKITPIQVKNFLFPKCLIKNHSQSLNPFQNTLEAYWKSYANQFHHDVSSKKTLNFGLTLFCSAIRTIVQGTSEECIAMFAADGLGNVQSTIGANHVTDQDFLTALRAQPIFSLFLFFIGLQCIPNRRQRFIIGHEQTTD